jgi:hypothetical protein
MIKTKLTTNEFYSNLIKNSKELNTILYSLVNFKNLKKLKKLIETIESFNNLTPIGVLEFNRYFDLSDTFNYVCDDNDYNLGLNIVETYSKASKI